MKKNIVTILFSLICLFSCKNSTNNVGQSNIGIDLNLLKYIDSIPYCYGKDSFITVNFTVDTLFNPIISIKNVGFVPVSPKPSEPQEKILISKMDYFVGYTKYKKRILLFTRYKQNTKCENFIDTSYLRKDEKIFDENDTYNSVFYQNNHRRVIELILKISNKDSLVLKYKKNHCR